MILAVIQARLGSTRLPNKALLPIAGIPSLEHVIKRVKLAKMVDTVALATTLLEKDEELIELAMQNDIDWYRGSEDDVLTRFYDCAKFYEADFVIRITGDCPFIDPAWINLVVLKLRCFSPDDSVYVHNIEPRRLPDGLDVEGFTFAALEAAHRNCDNAYDREHVCHWMMDNCRQVSLTENETNLSHHRWTLDTSEDYEWFCGVAELIDCTPPHPTTTELLELKI